MESSSLRFAQAVRSLAVVARRLELRMPAFRSPPRHPELTRTLRRRPDGGVTVAVTIRGRPWDAVLADMVDGILAANDLQAEAASGPREQLWEAVSGSDATVEPS